MKGAASRDAARRNMDRDVARDDASSPAQDANEMFEVCEAPTPSFDVRTDRPRGTGALARRADVHARGEWHRSAHVWIVDAKTRAVVLQKRSMGKDTFPGMWDISAAGHVSARDDGDSLRAAACELEEELGVRLSDARRDLTFQFCIPAAQAALGGCNCYEDVYFLRWDRDSAGDDFALGHAEVTATRWESIDDLRAALNGASNEHVPRTKQYLDVFFPALDAFVNHDRSSS